MDDAVSLRVRFASRLKPLLSQKSLDSAGLAERSQVPLKRIEEILDGTYVSLTLNDMDRIAAALETPLYKLLSPHE